MKYDSMTYASPTRCRLALQMVLLCTLPAPCTAAIVYQWTDATGVVHFSDSAPLKPPADSREHKTVPARSTHAQGLRAGEQATLRAIERRRQQQHRAAKLARQHNDRAAAERRKDCREHRDRQRDTGDHTARKALSTYLRRNCW